MLNVLSSTGMLEKVWKKVNFLKLVKIWLLSRKDYEEVGVDSVDDEGEDEEDEY
eukprot:TRINITY_DN1979_c0_g1_i1.p3 TRINITY_DN1979_c0_g1~~TRINITY_DN1979_c0_g1_i1.p3  ORF type:complete len:54 (+),score=16.04 TRINITY_DN1979_c0_g1_i1:298-459(+)